MTQPRVKNDVFQSEISVTNKCAASLLREEDSFVSWHAVHTEHCPVTSAVALVVGKRNMGKQRVSRAILHLSNGQVFFVSLTHVTKKLAPLLNSIGEALIKLNPIDSKPEAIAKIEDSVDCSLCFLEENPKQLSNWHLESWRTQRTCDLALNTDLMLASKISAQINEEFSELTSEMESAIHRFHASLDQNILIAAERLNVLCFSAYNYLTHPDQIICRNRKQAVEIFPLLVVEILYQREPTPITKELSKVIDSGKKVINWVASTFHVRISSVRALRYLTESEIGDSWRGRTKLLLFLLSTLPPERFPKNRSQWQALVESIGFIRAMTNRPINSAAVGILLGEIANRNWQLDKSPINTLQERIRCTDVFIRNFSNALAAYIKVEHREFTGRYVADAQAVVTDTIVRLGLRRVESIAAKWLALKRNSDADFPDNKQNRQFPRLLIEPFQYQDLTIIQLLSQDELNNESKSLKHCVSGYGADCYLGRSIIFSVRDQYGSPRSTFEIEIKPHSLFVSQIQIELIQHKALENSNPCAKDREAVSLLLRHLKGSDSLPSITNFTRDRFLNQLEPALARDYRYALLMQQHIATTSGGRIWFDELVTKILLRKI